MKTKSKTKNIPEVILTLYSPLETVVRVSNFKKTGITKTKAIIENKRPPVEPTAKENQKGSLSPSI